MDGRFCTEAAPKNIAALLDCMAAFPVWLDRHGWQLDARAPLPPPEGKER